MVSFVASYLTVTCLCSLLIIAFIFLVFILLPVGVWYGISNVSSISFYWVAPSICPSVRIVVASPIFPEKNIGAERDYACRTIHQNVEPH